MRLEFEHSKQDYYSEIDAVEIIGYSHDSLTSKKIGFNLRKIADSFSFLSVKDKNSNDDSAKHQPKADQEPAVQHLTPICGSSSSLTTTTESSEPAVAKQTSQKYQRSFSLSKETRRKSSQSTQATTSCPQCCLATLTHCSNLTELPNEILNIILSYLDLRALFNLRATCKHFYDICSDEYLYQKLDLQPYWHLVDDSFIHLLADLTNDVKMINLSWTKLASKEVLERFFINSCQSLITLKMDNCLIVDEEVLNIIGNTCPNLENLSLVGCMNHGEDSLTALSTENKHRNSFIYLKNLKNLVNLNLYRSAVDTESIVQILVSCHRLKHLNLGSCINIADFDLIMEVISVNCKHIESLDLWRAYSLSNAGLSKIANNCLDLVELDIGWW